MPDATESSTKPPCYREDAADLVRHLREHGHVAYFAGGCVRDLLLGQTPKDYDVATDAPPRRVRQLFSNTQAVGAAFGVILVRLGQSVVEVATFRKDGQYLDGRRPSEVVFTTAQEDAQRRDFTINGLFLDPLDGDRIIDYVGGQEDLRLGRLRAIGLPTDRFQEDHLRLLRAVRFAARFDLQIEANTAAAMADRAPLLKEISPERIAEELRMMLTPITRNTAWRMLWQFGLLDVVYRFVPHGPTPPFDTQGSLLLNMAPGQAIGFGAALAAGSLCFCWRSSPAGEEIRQLLTCPAVDKLVRGLRKALRLSNEHSDELQSTLEGIGPLLAENHPTVAGMKRFLARSASYGSRQLLGALAAADLCQERIAWLSGQLAALEKTEVAPLPLITGDDLTAAGLPPGPRFKQILNTVYDAQLEGRITTRDEAMELAISLG